jgi:hypothetical protein
MVGIHDHVSDEPEIAVADSRADAQQAIAVIDDGQASGVWRLQDGTQRPVMDRPADLVAKLGDARQVGSAGTAQAEPIGELHRTESSRAGSMAGWMNSEFATRAWSPHSR